jgi:tetratricopeptide (TPR) repeat protein
VTPYLEGDLLGAASALDAAGQTTQAHELRARAYQQRGDAESAARELQAAGHLTESAQLYSETSDDPASAAHLFEQAGELDKAGEAYRSAGDLVRAAQCFEGAYDYENAVDCYRELGDAEKVIELLERAGDFFEAGKEALEADQPDRAIQALQKVEGRHAFYTEACRMLAEILFARGEVDLALEKFEESGGLAGSTDVPLEKLERFGQALEEAGRAREALAFYEAIRRRDLQYGDVNTRIELLRQEVGTAGTHGMPGTQVDTQASTLMRSSAEGAAAAAAVTGTAPTAPRKRRYELLDELGRGGMGVVYRAKDSHLGRVVALKLLPENLRDHPAAVKLFLREARSAAALNHPNIVTIFDAGQEVDGTYFISMEYLEGVTVDSVLRKKGALPVRTVAGLGLQAATGLEYAHRQKIVHRDIKAANLFVTRDKVVKVMDFGLAKMIEEVRRNSTMIGGTPNFMAPEQAAGEAVDHRTDLYSLGATLFQLVTGTVPFEGGDVTYHHRHTPAPDPRERRADVPDPMAKLILKLMQKRPEDRCQSAKEVAAALQQLLGRPGSSAS